MHLPKSKSYYVMILQEYDNTMCIRISAQELDIDITKHILYHGRNRS